MAETNEDQVAELLDKGIILCWNRDHEDAWPTPDYDSTLGEMARDGVVLRTWSVGQHKNIEPGTRAFLLAQGQKHPRGLIGYGVVHDRPFSDEHWRDAGKTTNYIPVVWFELLPFDEPIPVSVLDEYVPSIPWKTGIQGSGFPVKPEVLEDLLEAWYSNNPSSEEGGPGELPPGDYREGAVRTVMVNRYERDRLARLTCLEHHGYACKACHADLRQVYGNELGERAIHVHHIVPMATRGGEEYELDPIEDLVPLCPNCHNVIHKTDPVMTPQEFREQVLGK